MKETYSPQFLTMVHEVKKRIKEITIEDVRARLDNRISFVLVDVREENEWKKAHIAGAIHLSKGVIEMNIERTIRDPMTEIVLYCSGGHRSALVVESLKKMGYRHVTSMKGGISDWRNAGYPTES